MGLAALVPLLRTDAAIAVKEAIIALLVTEAHIIIRFQQYLECPTKIWRMCRVYNPVEFAACIEEFTEAPTHELDVG